jgi:hypothetical protein
MIAFFVIIGVVFLMTFWFDFFNHLFSRHYSFTENSFDRLKSVYQPFEFFGKYVYNKFFKKQKEQILG